MSLQNYRAYNKRLKFTQEQNNILEQYFNDASGYLNPAEVLDVQEKTSLSSEQIRKWFANKRARVRRKMINIKCDKFWDFGLYTD